MNSTQHLLGAALAVCLLGTASTARGQSIINGTFDTPVPSNGTGGGWTSGNITGGGWQSTGGNPGTVFILNQSGELATDPFISQVVSGFIQGETYQLTGDYAVFAGGFGNPSAMSFAVDIDGVTVQTFGRPGGEGVYGSFLVPFVAPGPEVTIRLRAEINGDDGSYYVDNIALVVVPEPSAAALAAAGVLLGAALRRVRRPRP